MSHRRVGNRDVGLAAALVAGASGVVARDPVLLLAASVGLVYAAYEAATRLPDPDLEIERSVTPTNPRPGEPVDVTVTVRNHGTRVLPDVRVVDGVPRRLGVVDGTPRFGTALEPDEEASFSYTLRARRGDHPFSETSVVCRNLSADAEYREAVPVEFELSCTLGVDEVALAPATVPFPGRVESESPGEGVSFYGIREYQPADPLSRVDWNRLARTAELSTVEFEATRASSVVLLVDERMEYAAGPREPTASQLSKYAAERIGTSLLDDDNPVGAALFDGDVYLPPRTDRTQRLRIRRLLLYECAPDEAPSSSEGSMLDGFDGRAFFESETEETRAVADGGFGSDAGESPTGSRSVGETDVTSLHRRLPGDAQVVFCTPLLDSRARDVAKRLAACGREVTVVSPDVTTGDTPGNTVERITRADRIDDLRGTVGVVDWDPSEPLSTGLARASAGWSR